MSLPSRGPTDRFWAIPAACAAASVLLAYGLARLDRLVGDTASAVLFPGPPSGARSFLGAVISAMISFTGLVFSITVVVLVLTSGQFSPRVLRQFLRDRTIQLALGLFVATFLFAMTTLREVTGSDGPDAFVPRISVTVAFLLVLVSVGIFIVYIDHVVHMIQVSSIMVRIGDETRELIETRLPGDPGPEAPEPDLAGDPVTITIRDPGVITAVDEPGMVASARADGVVVRLAARVGDFRPAGAALLTLHGPGADSIDDPERYRRFVRVETERTMDQDVAFGLRQLVDIATKALSPGINDPTTACQVLDVLHDLLRRLVTRPALSGRHTDPEGTTRLLVPSYDVDDLVDVALIEVWHFGSTSTQIPARFSVMLTDLRQASRPEHAAVLDRWLATIER